MRTERTLEEVEWSLRNSAVRTAKYAKTGEDDTMERAVQNRLLDERARIKKAAK